MVQGWLLPLFWFCAKTGSILFVFMWVRGTLPRFRYDQLMGFTWKFLFPVAMLNLLVTGFLVAWYVAEMDVILFLDLRDRSRWCAPSTWWCRRIRFRAPSR